MNPHLILLDEDYYHEDIKPHLAHWLLFWLRRDLNYATEVGYVTKPPELEGEGEAQADVDDTEDAQTPGSASGGGVDEVEFTRKEKAVEAVLLGASEESEEAKMLNRELGPAVLRLINLGRAWCNVFTAHVISKIDRVSYGLLQPGDIAALEAGAKGQHKEPPSRLLLAVPFVGKDSPSQSSEFAHAEVLIGLAVLAYRYEGLRREDCSVML